MHVIDIYIFRIGNEECLSISNELTTVTGKTVPSYDALKVYPAAKVAGAVTSTA